MQTVKPVKSVDPKIPKLLALAEWAALDPKPKPFGGVPLFAGHRHMEALTASIRQGQRVQALASVFGEFLVDPKSDPLETRRLRLKDLSCEKSQLGALLKKEKNREVPFNSKEREDMRLKISHVARLVEENQEKIDGTKREIRIIERYQEYFGKPLNELGKDGLEALYTHEKTIYDKLNAYTALLEARVSPEKKKPSVEDYVSRK